MNTWPLCSPTGWAGLGQTKTQTTARAKQASPHASQGNPNSRADLT
ncbi:hypothetical protein [Meiothermus hypogaeus]|nr:hypothetical protein [Meiothermus hypogaeus]